MKMDKKLVASKEDNEREIKYISTTYRINLAAVRKAIATLKKAGKGWRSRKSIYHQLRLDGYVVKTKRYEA